MRAFIELNGIVETPGDGLYRQFRPDGTSLRMDWLLDGLAVTVNGREKMTLTEEQERELWEWMESNHRWRGRPSYKISHDLGVR